MRKKEALNTTMSKRRPITGQVSTRQRMDSGHVSTRQRMDSGQVSTEQRKSRQGLVCIII